MKIINCTPHKVDVCDEYGNIVKTYEPSGTIARVASTCDEIGTIDGIPLFDRRPNKLFGLPDEEEGTVYIVSDIVRKYVSNRMDVVTPAMQIKVNGRTIGCRGFVGNRRED